MTLPTRMGGGQFLHLKTRIAARYDASCPKLGSAFGSAFGSLKIRNGNHIEKAIVPQDFGNPCRC